LSFVDEWNNLYANLIARHGIRGLSAFSANSFKAQLAVPGISIFRATDHDETVGMTLWYADAASRLGVSPEAVKQSGDPAPLATPPTEPLVDAPRNRQEPQLGSTRQSIGIG